MKRECPEVLTKVLPHCGTVLSAVSDSGVSQTSQCYSHTKTNSNFRAKLW